MENQGDKLNFPERTLSVLDLTHFDELAPGTPFKKVWKLQNNGAVSWPLQATLAHSGGESFSASEVVNLDIQEGGLQPGEKIEISVDLVSPEEPGDYEGKWMLISPEGEEFGSPLFCGIKVVPKSQLYISHVNSGVLPTYCEEVDKRRGMERKKEMREFQEWTMELESDMEKKLLKVLELELKTKFEAESQKKLDEVLNTRLQKMAGGSCVAGWMAFWTESWQYVWNWSWSRHWEVCWRRSWKKCLGNGGERSDEIGNLLRKFLILWEEPLEKGLKLKLESVLKKITENELEQKCAIEFEEKMGNQWRSHEWKYRAWQ